MRNPTSLPLPGVLEVHVWSAPSEDEAFRGDCSALLSESERRRAEAFRFYRDRMRFAASHALLRIVLGRYLDRRPSDIGFLKSSHGKPALLPTENPDRLTFNLSESGGRVLIAVARDHAVGVDIEQVRPVPECDDIARGYFSASEQAELAALPASERVLGFFHGWTRKEAVLKAVGCGLRARLDSFGVTLTPGRPSRLTHCAPHMGSPADWSIRHIEPAPGFVGAVAMRQRGVRARHSVVTLSSSRRAAERMPTAATTCPTPSSRSHEQAPSPGSTTRYESPSAAA